MFVNARPGSVHGALLLVGVAFLLPACGTADSLDGSIRDLMSLEHDRILILAQDKDLVVEYKLGVDQIVAKLVVKTDGEDLTGKQVTGDDFLKRVTLSRTTVKKDQFPATLHGLVHFTSISLTSGGHVAGDFNIVFIGGYGIDGRFDGGATLDGATNATTP